MDKYRKLNPNMKVFLTRNLCNSFRLSISCWFNLFYFQEFSGSQHVPLTEDVESYQEQEHKKDVHCSDPSTDISCKLEKPKRLESVGESSLLICELTLSFSFVGAVSLMYLQLASSFFCISYYDDISGDFCPHHRHYCGISAICTSRMILRRQRSVLYVYVCLLSN